VYQARLAGNKFTPNFKRANFWSPVITALGLFLHRVTDIASYIDDIYDCALLSWKYNFPIREVPGTVTASRNKPGGREHVTRRANFKELSQVPK